MTTNSSAAGNLDQARMVPNSNNKNPETHNPDAQTSSNCCEKKRRCYTIHGTRPPIPTILRPVAGITFEMSSFCAYNCKVSQFKHLLCYLCSIVNKMLAYVILNYFSFHFIKKKKKTSQHLWNSGCIMDVSIFKVMYVYIWYNIFTFRPTRLINVF